ncbi:hypothetical protein KH5_16980 [Urechidicola sp. KH5]
MPRISFILVLLCFSTISFAQFKFSGQANTEQHYEKAFLVLIDDYTKTHVLLTEQIVQETTIDKDGYFEFTGDFLPEQNRFYKIYLDQCNDSITNSNHLLNYCDHSSSIIFIANNTNSIHFPINDLNQMFCDISDGQMQNTAIQKIDSLQEVLLNDIQFLKSDFQRKIRYSEYVKQLQSFSETFNEPLAELYAFHLYANSASFSYDAYLNDTKESNYYQQLFNKLEDLYPNTLYTERFKNESVLSLESVSSRNLWVLSIILIIALSISLYFNFRNIKKQKQKNAITLDVLSSQEKKVVSLILEGKTNKEIANTLFISISTVKTHINNCYSKLQVSTRKELKLLLKK